MIQVEYNGPNADRSAYPWVAQEGIAPGLTKRELFAAMALQGLLASESKDWQRSHEEIAELAVSQADALIVELEQ